MRLELRDIHKSFGENEVLRGVDVEISGGEVVALVGENGAGKSTLTRVISGAHRPDRGQILIDGDEVELKTPQDAMDRGIQVIYQEFLNNVFPQLSVAENLFTLDQDAHFGRAFVKKARMRREAREIMAGIGLTVDPTVPAGSLSVAELQMIEIAKSTNHNMRLLILDEPTAALDDQESQQLFDQIDRLRRQGIAIIYISHRLEEVFDLSDRIVVLRNGSVVHDSPTSEVAQSQIVTAMVGKSVDDLYPKGDHSPGDVVLRLDGISSSGEFSDVSFDVRAGEILGIGGVMGCGKGSVLRALFGLLPVQSGSIRLQGDEVRVPTPKAAIERRIGYIPPDRQAEGLCLQQSISDNMSLASLPAYSATGFMNRRSERAATQKSMDSLNVRATSKDDAVSTLSGGNQQKVLFGRWTMTNPTVLLMEEPTRGVDIGAKAEIYRIINAQAAAGAAVILVSSDIPELVEMSDRLLVMREGRVVAELEGDQMTQQNLLKHALESAA